MTSIQTRQNETGSIRLLTAQKRLSCLSGSLR